MNKYFAAAAAATVLSFASLTSAYAKDISVDLYPTVSGTLTNGFSNYVVASGTFTDIFTFSPDVSTSSIVAQVTAYNFTADTGISFTSVSLNGYSLFTSSVQTPAVALTAGTVTIDGPTQLVLTVTGNSVGGGSYGGNINVKAVSAVPEPATYGMMLGGIGLIGFMARRRKSAGAAPALAA